MLHFVRNDTALTDVLLHHQILYNFRLILSRTFVSTGFLEYLQPSGVRTAYRGKAFETHPDRAGVVGEAEGEMNERFKEVVQSYEKLLLFVENEKPYLISHKPDIQKKNKKTTARKKERTQEWVSDHFYKGPLPRQKLLIGEFLYYSRLISWGTLIDAIIWQRRQRPLIGQIAVGWGILSLDEVGEILSERSWHEKFGEHALRRGYITRFELMALRRQRILQRPIGEYFVEVGILNTQEIDKMVEDLLIRNRSTGSWL